MPPNSSNAWIAARPSMPSIKLYRLISQTQATANSGQRRNATELSTVAPNTEKTGNFGIDHMPIATTTKWAHKRSLADTSPKSSQTPKASITKPRLINAIMVESGTQSSHEKSTPKIIEMEAMAMPPPWGVGMVWEQRSLGRTSALRRTAQERTAAVIAAAQATTVNMTRARLIGE